MTFEKVSQIFDVPNGTIRSRASRESWATVERVQQIKGALQQKCNATPSGAQLVAQSLVERQEEHREIVHRMMRKALKNAEKAPPSIENMTDLEKAVKIHRLTLDMSTGETGPGVQILFTGSETQQAQVIEQEVDVIDCEDVEELPEEQGESWV
jgi:formiminotetrahydrofolate cyclodeaminase